LFRYSLAASYLFGSAGPIYEFFFAWCGPTIVGAAASRLWPVVLLSLCLDGLVLKSLVERKDPTGFVAAQFGLSVIVLLIEAPVLALLEQSWLSFLALEVIPEAAFHLMIVPKVAMAFLLNAPSVILIWAAGSVAFIVLSKIAEDR
jgi:hypothetical protein